MSHEMTEMGIAVFAAHLRSPCPQTVVLLLDDIFTNHRLPETRPAGARFEFVRRAEQRFTRRDIDVDARLLVVPELVSKGALGALFLGYRILQIRQLLA